MAMRSGDDHETAGGQSAPATFESLHRLGARCFKRGDYAAALQHIDAALNLNPRHAAALNDRGSLLMELKRFDEALASFDRAIELDPSFAEALNNRGNAFGEMNRVDEALASYGRAIALKPNYAEAHHNRGSTLTELRRFDEAVECYDKAIACRPDYAKAFRNRGMVRLLEGHYRDGWADYEWRWKVEGFWAKAPKIDAPLWTGGEIAGRALLVVAEQGLGDVIQFVRYLPLLSARGARVILLVPAKLHRLLRCLGPKIELVNRIPERSTFDFQCPLISLPHRFGTDATSIPNAIPYLAPEEQLIRDWKQRIGEHGFKIGIAWKAQPAIDRGRSFPLTELFPLSRLAGVRLISLQKHHGLDELAALPAGVEVETLGDEFDGGTDAFIDAAAAMSSLDLIVTSDTSIAHLAGALGRRTWGALKFVPDWRWLLDREDSPWHPTLRLFRQDAPRDWKPVFSGMEHVLQTMLGGADAKPALRRKKNAPRTEPERTFHISGKTLAHEAPMSEIQNVLEQIRKTLAAGQTSLAITEIRALMESGATGPDAYRLLALAYLKDDAFDAAIETLRSARAAGTDSATETAFGRFLNAEGFKDAALDCFLAAVKIDADNEDALGLICMPYADAGKPNLAIPYGQRSLEVRDRQGAKSVEAVAAKRPKRFNPSSPKENIIAFSLFGDNPYYWECAMANASMAFALFPEWRCRFYCDRNVPQSVRNVLLRVHSQLFVSDGVSENWSGLIWRFEAYDDPEVNVVMVCDVDSPFTLRDSRAVDEWLASD